MKDIKQFLTDHFSKDPLYELDIEYDGVPLIWRLGRQNFSTIYYIKEENGLTVREQLKSFDTDNLFQIFLEDIAEQLMNGVDRNNLKINIPHELKRVKIGDKIIEI